MKLRVVADVGAFRKQMLTRGYTVADLSRYSGVSETAIYRILQGGSTSPRIAKRLSIVMLTHQDKLFKDAESHS